MRILNYSFISLLLIGGYVAAQSPDLQSIRRKVQAGEQLTQEEQRTLQEANAVAQKKRREEYLKDHKPVASTGNIALPDLGAGTYRGEQGGLYPGGSNTIPAEHLAAGLKLAKQIKPLDADGNPSPDGRIVLLSIGFSNPNMEFPAFQRLAAAETGLNPKLLLVNGCVGGQASSVIADPKSNYWNLVRQHLSAAGATPKQVQALWIKEVVPGPGKPFPVEAKQLADDYTSTLRNVKQFFPNAKVAFLSNRTYGGWTEAGGSPEPWAYESGFAVKWAIAAQIANKPLDQVWAEWGPYLWTDGEKGRKDGSVYLRSDVGGDGLHPSPQGQQKIGSMLLKFFMTDPVTKTWFLK
jgi:hypothetical protein